MESSYGGGEANLATQKEAVGDDVRLKWKPDNGALPSMASATYMTNPVGGATEE